MSRSPAFRVVSKPVKPAKLERAVGTSVAYVAYIPRHEHLFFAHQHNRDTGDLERIKPLRSWLQLIAIGAFCCAGVAAAVMLLV